MLHGEERRRIMKKFNKYTALLLAFMLIITSCVFAVGVNAAAVDTAETGADSITIHYYSEKANPYVYYLSLIHI